MSDFLFTFIIPHYGIPDLLCRCVCSIPQKEDIQIIIVDDRSPAYETYREQYPDLFRPGIQWIRAPRHAGAGYARNLGLDRADGKWVLFADADDFYSDGLNEFLEENKDAPEDIIYFRNECRLSDQPDQPSSRSDWMGRLFDHYRETRDSDYLEFNHWAPWGKMIRRSFLTENQIRFEEIPYSNDVVFSALCASKAHSVRIVDTVLYLVTEREGSLTSQSRRKPGEMAIRANAALEAQKIANGQGFHRLLFPLPHYLYKMYYHDRPLFHAFFRRIPEVYPSYWEPMKMMVGFEKGILRKGLLLVFLLSTYLRTKACATRKP